MDPAGLEALAAALEVLFGARREQHLYSRRGRGCVSARGAAPPRKIDLADHVIALRLRGHLHLPVTIIAALLGVDRTTVSHATSLAAELIAASGIPLPPAGPPAGIRLRTPGDLSEYATAAGISLTIPEIGAKTPKYTRRKQAATAARPEQPT